MKVWRKQTVKWKRDGKRVKAGTERAERCVTLSKRFYGTLTDADGKRQQVPLCEDREASERLLRRLQTEADKQRALGLAKHERQRQRPVSAFVDEYEAYLRSKGNTERYVTQAASRIRRLLKASRIGSLDELDASKIAATLFAWRQRKDKPLTPATTNDYSRAVKAFSRWLWIERRTPDDPLRSLRLLNAKANRKRTRRAFTPTELERLTKATAESDKRCFGLSPADRSMLYVVAAYTGLRASELASLTKASFNLEAKTVTVLASYSKRRRNDTLPLHPSLIDRLTPWLASKGNGFLWPGTWTNRHKRQAAKMLRRDLKRAAIAYVDDAGRFADFHALRHTFITSLARAGVHPSKAKELARHSTITLTLDVYSHVSTDELREALNALPSIGTVRE